MLDQEYARLVESLENDPPKCGFGYSAIQRRARVSYPNALKLADMLIARNVCVVDGRVLHYRAAQLASERNGPPSPAANDDDNEICDACLEKSGRYTTCSNVRECYPENYNNDDEDY